MTAPKWTPVTLALTHLLTLGFLTMTMVGALIQILPVVAGDQLAESNNRRMCKGAECKEGPARR